MNEFFWERAVKFPGNFPAHEKQKKMQNFFNLKKTKLETNETIFKFNPLLNSCHILSCEKLPEELCLSKEHFDELYKTHPKEYGLVKIYGKEIPTPRYQQSYGEDYAFSGMVHKALPLEHPFLKKLLAWVCEHSGKKYQQVLVNWYDNGNHYIGAHSDDERQLVKGSDIYSFSFGATRTFRVKAKKNKGIEPFKTKDFIMNNNSLLIMGGRMQEFFTHEVPKCSTKTMANFPEKRRINVTFRHFIEHAK